MIKTENMDVQHKKRLIIYIDKMFSYTTCIAMEFIGWEMEKFGSSLTSIAAWGMTVANEKGEFIEG